MTTYRMEDETIVKTENASKSWGEKTEFDGSNNISVATGSQWQHQNLHRSRKGRYWIEHWSDFQGQRNYANWISQRLATGWLLLNDYEISEELEQYRDDVEE